jgi:hypothetical protein
MTAEQASKLFGISIGEVNSLLAEHGEIADTVTEKETKIVGAFENVKTQALNLMEAYKNAKDAARDSIDSQVQLFSDLDTKTKLSIDNVIASMDGQIEYLAEYNDNLITAMKRGVDEGIIAALSDGEEGSAKILAAIVTGSDEQIKKLNESFKGVETGKDRFTSTIGIMKTDFLDAMDELKGKLDDTIAEADQYTEMSENGKNTVQGYIDGIKSMMYLLEKTAKDLSDAVPKVVSDRLQIKSPSKVMIGQGADTGEGFAVGLRGKIGAIGNVGKDIADAVARAASVGGGVPSLSGSLALSKDIASAGGMLSPVTSGLSGTGIIDNSSSATTSVDQNITVNVQADDLRKMADVVDLFDGLRQASRQG